MKEQILCTSALYIVATPIGNLGDISERAKTILEYSDFIIAEDTRRTSILLNVIGIKKEIVSYYKDLENKRVESILKRLKEGEKAALVCDAGTPAVSDPGAILVKKAREAKINIFVVPGPCAAVAAFSMSGYNSGYVFLGFLKGKKNDIKKSLNKYIEIELPLIFYSPPHDINNDLKTLYSVFGRRKVQIAREMTKINEEFIEGYLDDINLEKNLGEYVIIIEGAKKSEENEFDTIEEALLHFLKEGLDPKEAIKKAAKNFSTNKDEAYKEYLRLKGKQ